LNDEVESVSVLVMNENEKTITMRIIRIHRTMRRATPDCEEVLFFGNKFFLESSGCCQICC